LGIPVRNEGGVAKVKHLLSLAARA
jgi:hypothetical protein